MSRRIVSAAIALVAAAALAVGTASVTSDAPTHREANGLGCCVK